MLAVLHGHGDVVVPYRYCRILSGAEVDARRGDGETVPLLDVAVEGSCQQAAVLIHRIDGDVDVVTQEVFGLISVGAEYLVLR